MPNKRKPQVCEMCATTFRPTYVGQRTCSRQCGIALRRASTRPVMCQSCGDTFQIATAGDAKRTCDGCLASASCPPTPCGICSAPVPRPRQKYCSDSCATMARRRNDQMRGPTIQLTLLSSCGECGAPTTAGRKRCDTCITANRAGRKRRERIRLRVLHRTVQHEPYTLYEVAGWTDRMCGLCAAPVDLELLVPNPGAPTIDHILPLARGGHDVRANVQLAHFRCNSIKRDQVFA